MDFGNTVGGRGASLGNFGGGGNANYKTPQQLAQEQEDQLRQREAENRAQNQQASIKAQQDAAANQAAWERQQAIQRQSSQAAVQGLTEASPSYQSGAGVSNYTGAPTSPMEAQRAQLQLEAQFAGQNATAQNAPTQENMNLSAKLQAEAEARRMGQLPQIMQSLGANDSGGSGGSGMGVDESAARAAAFSRAKDQRGQVAAQALQALQNQMAGRGLQGSTIEAGHAGDIIAEAGGGLEDFSNEQALLDVNRAGALADRDFAGNLTRRGQNLGLAPSLLGLIGQRALY